MSNLYQHEQSDKRKWIVTAISFFLVAVLFVILGLQVFGTGKQKPSEWFQKPPTEQTEPEFVEDESGNQLESGKVYDMPQNLIYTRAATNDATEPQELTLKAVITPSDAYNTKLDWEVSFVNSSSGWATGKTVTNYVTVPPTADGSLQAKVKCLAPFGAQIKITATLRMDPSKSAECKVDFRQKLLGYKMTIARQNGEKGVYEWNIDKDAALEETGDNFQEIPVLNDYTNNNAVICEEVYTTVYTKPVSNRGYQGIVLSPTDQFVSAVAAGLNVREDEARQALFKLDSFNGDRLDGFESCFDIPFLERFGAARKDKLLEVIRKFKFAEYQVEFLTAPKESSSSETLCRFYIDLDVSQTFKTVESVTMGQGTIEF